MLKGRCRGSCMLGEMEGSGEVVVMIVRPIGSGLRQDVIRAQVGMYSHPQVRSGSVVAAPGAREGALASFSPLSFKNGSKIQTMNVSLVHR